VNVTAAHCVRGADRSTFTAGAGVPGSFMLKVECKAGALGSAGSRSKHDWAYCILPDDARIDALPVTPPLVGCEAERFLKAGATAWVVGFGLTGADKSDSGIKRQVQVRINHVRDGMLDVGDKDVGACHGDSGGPLYVRLFDGTHDWGWRVAGSTAGAGSLECDCACSTLYVDIEQHVRAIEADTNIDVTPCTDPDGSWAPSAQCSAFIRDPQAGSGTYPRCSVPMTTEVIETCGPSANAGVAGAAGMAQPTAGDTALATGGMNGAAGQDYLPSGGVGDDGGHSGHAGHGGAASDISAARGASTSSAGCRAASNATSAPPALFSLLLALAWQLRRTRGLGAGSADTRP